MTTIQANMPRTTLIQAVEGLSMEEFTAFFNDVLDLRARRIAPSLNVEETMLLQQIYASQLPETEHNRLLELGTKLEVETLRKIEREELMSLTDKSERLNADRISAVAQLATLRQKPLREMMQQLNLWNSHAPAEG